MDKSNYVIWGIKKVKHAVVLDRLLDVPKQYEFRKGVSRIQGWPEAAKYTQDMDFPDNTILVDSLMNIDFRIIASARLKRFLESWQLQKVEYLPLTILDHKGRVRADDYFFVHPIEPIDCLKIDDCGVKWDLISTDSIFSLERLAVEEGKIDSDRQLFRLKHFYRVTLIGRDLAYAIDREGFTGIRWIEFDNYPET